MENQIKKLRNVKRLTQRELAEELNVIPLTIIKWENGQVIPSIKNIRKLEKFFGETLNF